MINRYAHPPYRKKRLSKSVRQTKHANAGLPETAYDHTFKNSATSFNAERAFKSSSQYCSHYAACRFRSINLIIRGPRHSGKTYLLHCIANDFISYDIPVLFVDESDLLEKLFFAKTSPTTFLEIELMRYKTAQVLILDNLGSSLHYAQRDEDINNPRNWRTDVYKRISILGELFAFRKKYNLPTIVSTELLHFNSFYSDPPKSPIDAAIENSIVRPLRIFAEQCELWERSPENTSTTPNKKG
ncbi:ATP-binding protein [Bengtsoniella intestinalis]|uniref:ATP-binding protein n=1 Tax=Bengtsoniella intestinalis TaxID=3073143 RepID=UPI00391F9CF7